MPDYQLIGPFGVDHPAALVGEGRRIGAAPAPSDVILRNFPAACWDAAMQLYLRAKQVGIAVAMGGKSPPRKVGKWWRFGGATGHLTDAAIRLGVSTAAIHRAEADATLKNTATRIGEAYGRYTQVKGPTKPDRDFMPEELRHIRVLLDRCEADDARLHAMADAARGMIEECRAEFGLPPGVYRYRVAGPGDDDAATAPLRAEAERLGAELGRAESRIGEAVRSQQARHVEEVARLGAEVDRLRAENAEALAHARDLAAMVESLTAPAAGPAAPSSPPKPAPPKPPQNKGR